MSDDLSVSPSGEISVPEQPAPDGPRRVFFGDDGLRAGWSALLFLLITVALVLTLGTAARFLFPPPHPGQGATARGAFIGEFMAAASVLIATAIMARIEKRRVVAYAYTGRAAGALFMGCPMGLRGAFLLGRYALASAYAGIQSWTSSRNRSAEICADLDGRVFFSLRYLKSRSFANLLSTLTRGLGFWWGALILSFLFGAVHSGNGGESPVGVFAAGAVGGSSSASACGTRARCGGPSVFIPPGTGRKPTFTEPRTVDWSHAAAS